MSNCENCDRLQRLLSPFEDPDFTASYLLLEPTEWLWQQESRFDGQPAIVVDINELYQQTFGEEHTTHTIKKLADTLKALGWSKTFRRGVPYWAITMENFEYAHRRG